MFSRIIQTCKCNRSVANRAPRFIQTAGRYRSSQAAVKEPSDGRDIEQQNDPHTAVQDASQKPLTNTPFTKNIFMGKFDTSILVYPEISDNEELQELEAMVEPIEKFFEQMDSKSMDINAKIPDETLQQLKDLGLFGMQIPVEYGGLGLNATKFARMGELTSIDGGVAVTLAAHQAIGLKGILIDGTEEQKAKYLPKLATGEHVAAFALTEPSSGSDAASIQTKARLSEDGTHYLLNGSKIWISNGGFADIFTVFAKTEEINEDTGETVEKVTAFIVERAFGGLTSGPPEDKLGIRCSNTCAVFFEDVPIPVENVLGKVGGGFKVAMNILNSGRFSMGSSGAGGLKKLLKMTQEHATTRSQFGQKLSDFGMIQEKFAKIAMTTYAMESMAYLTSGILDGHQKPDASVEAAMVKIFSSEGVWMGVNECLQILGGLGYMKDYPYERYMRDARILLIFEGTNEILRLYVALTCFQYAGTELRQQLKKLSNPFNNMGFLVSKAWERMGNTKNPKPRHKLHDHLHPSIVEVGEELDKRVVQMQFLVEHYLSLYKNDIFHEQMALKRFADIAVDIYAITACAARATRSLSIGLKNADHEAMMTRTFAYDACKRIDNNVEELWKGKFNNGDDNLRQIADTIFKNGGWAAEHPLTRNW